MKTERYATISKAKGDGLAHPLGDQIPPQHATEAGKGAPGFNICLAGCQSCFSLINPFYFPVSPFWNGNVYPVPVPQLYLGSSKSFVFISQGLTAGRACLES